ncbi:hypothetical protein KB553_12630 [Chryseobacterium rhizoplanae]|uniref:hypothetical protein n=1 Tax=Chryseobacterium rhizoplanae TaxID=1609531 RepID=UPI001CE3887C|nr:hypothetical protein [Chryseobacterium rhizoplanae]UCA57900.1 hypothetical protein KB553_12630 [Chryseobacterium rhizoplanae]
MTSNVERFGDFYALKNNLLSKESGINILTENRTKESYQWFIRNYKNYQNKPLVKRVIETINHTELLVASKSNSKIKE